MSAKVILITGCSSGLGLSLAAQAAKAGHTVYATMRNLEKRQSLDVTCGKLGVHCNVKRLDICDMDSITICVESILKTEGRIDVLINNAGAGFVRTTEQASMDDVAWVMDVNFHGVVRCTKAVLPSMRAARSGHIINITSVGGLVGQPFNEIYCAAKFAVEGYTESLASYVQPNFGVKFTAIEPGGITSEFAGTALAHFTKTGGMIDDEYAPILKKYIGGAQARNKSGDAASVYQTSDEVATIALNCIGQTKPPIRLRTSQWAEDLCAFKTSDDPDGRKQQADVIKRFLS